MGDVADMMLDGTLCQSCGAFIGDAVGYPRSCSEGCGGESPREESKARRSNNRSCSKQLLIDNKIPFTVKNQGAHLIVQGPGGVIDFWPGTGKYICRQDKKEGRGVFGLIKLIKGKGTAAHEA